MDNPHPFSLAFPSSTQSHTHTHTMDSTLGQTAEPQKHMIYASVSIRSLLFGCVVALFQVKYSLQDKSSHTSTKTGVNEMRKKNTKYKHIHVNFNNKKRKEMSSPVRNGKN